MIWGYSEGGAASSWAAQLQSSYAPELHLRGVATGGVPADIVATARNLDGGPFFGFGVAALIGLDAAHPELHLANYLNGYGQQLVAAHHNDCLVGLIAAFALKDYRDILTTDVLALPDWQADFAQSRLGATAPHAPIQHPTAPQLPRLPQSRPLRSTHPPKRQQPSGIIDATNLSVKAR